MRNIITALEHKYQREFTDTEAMNKIITPSERQRFLHHMLQTSISIVVLYIYIYIYSESG